MLKKNLFKTIAASVALVALAACGESSTMDWKTLDKVTDATSLQRSIMLDKEDMSLVNAGLVYYRQLLKVRTTENQDRAKVLYNRIEMHAYNSVMLASDFNRVAELELLHLGWAKGMSAPYAQSMEHRVRAFDASAGIFRTTELMRPVVASAHSTPAYYEEHFQDALGRLNDLCLVATNPWSLNPSTSVAPALVGRVHGLTQELMDKVQNFNVTSGGRYVTTTPFRESRFYPAFQRVCVKGRTLQDLENEAKNQ